MTNVPETITIIDNRTGEQVEVPITNGGGDAKAIKAECPSVANVAPLVRGSAQVVFGNQNWSTIVMGATPEMLSVRDWPVISGRNISQSDVDGATKNCLIGQTIAENLFGAADPVGKIIRIKKIPFTVIGLLEHKGQSPQGRGLYSIANRPAQGVRQPVSQHCRVSYDPGPGRGRPEKSRR